MPRAAFAVLISAIVFSGCAPQAMEPTQLSGNDLIGAFSGNTVISEMCKARDFMHPCDLTIRPGGHDN